MTIEAATEALCSERIEEAAGICHQLLANGETSLESKAAAFNILGTICVKMDNYERASGLFARAISNAPYNARYYANRSASLRECNNPVLSIMEGEEAVRLAPRSADALLNLAASHTMNDEHDVARSLIRRALVLEPDNANAHFSFGHNLLLTGETSAGWREYAWNAKRPGVVPSFPCLPSIVWNGMNLGHEDLVVICDEGFGDAIQYARYLPEAAYLCRKLILVGKPELSILGRMEGVAKFCTDVALDIEHGAHCAISSLPGVLGEPCPKLSYLSYDTGLADAFENSLFSNSRYRIGLAWRGRPVPRGRSISFSALAGALQARFSGSQARFSGSNAVFVSLQPDVTDEEKAILPGMRCPALPTFEHTAAIMASLDVVVTIDSAVAHLAGAMGHHAYVLLSKQNDWRWGLEQGGPAPLYPSVRMIRQTKAGDWGGALDTLMKVL